MAVDPLPFPSTIILASAGMVAIVGAFWVAVDGQDAGLIRLMDLRETAHRCSI